MEGQSVGNSSSPAATAAGPVIPELTLIWPENLITDLAEDRRHRWSTPLAITSFIVAALIALMIGPVQLILLIMTGDVPFVADTYTPTAMRVSLLTSGLVAVAATIAMIQVWREQPKRTTMAIVFGIGAVLICALVWLAAFVISFQPAHLTVIMSFAVVLPIAGAFATYKRRYSPEMAAQPYHIAIAIIVAFGSIEALSSMIYLFSQSSNEQSNQAEIDALGKAQASAQINGISSELSDLVYTICRGTYDPVYIPEIARDTGLFECRASSMVYSVSGPLQPVTSESWTVSGAAFYFGKTRDPLIAAEFPESSGAKYLYRDLSTTENHELVLLLPAASEEILISSYTEQLLNIINARRATLGENNRNLLLSLFYTSELNTVVNTKDFILIAALNTLALIRDLPGGTSQKGYLNGRYGDYIYSADLNMPALTELSNSPLLYSSQTRDALNARRHITVTIDKDHDYTVDELRELLYANFIDPPTQ